MSRLRRRISSAHVIALAALFVSLGGTSYAAITITGKNVKNSSLTGKDVKNSSLTGSDVKNNSLTGADVKNLKGGDVTNGTLTGTDLKTDSVGGREVLEGTLGKVPSAANADHATNADKATNATNATNATHATNADHATSADSATNASHATTADNTDGASFSTLTYSTTSSSNTQLLNVNGLQIKASCSASNVTVVATTTGNNGRLSVARQIPAGSQFFNDTAFNSGDTANLNNGNNNEINLNYRTTPASILFPTGHVSVQLQTMVVGTLCVVDGHAISSSTGGLVITPFHKKAKK